jgi:hypothetical protein
LAERMLSGFNWLRIGAGGGLLWMWRWTFGFWRRGVSYLTAFKNTSKFK